MSSFARGTLLWLAAAAVKDQGELAVLDLDCHLASQENNRYPGEGKHQIGTYPTLNDCTPTGFFMAGRGLVSFKAHYICLEAVS